MTTLGTTSLATCSRDNSQTDMNAEEWMAAIVQSSEDAIYSMALDRRIISWNSGAEKLYGYSAAEFLGQLVDRIIPPERLREMEQGIDAVRLGEIRAPLETEQRTKTGARVSVSLCLSPIRNRAGDLVGMSMIARDITAKKQAEAALKTENDFTHALLDSLQEGIVACDAQGTLILFNEATRTFHGLPEQPLPPEQWAEHFDLFHPDVITRMTTQDIPLFRALQGETVRNSEMVVAPKNGQIRILLASGQAIYGADGQILGAVIAMHDVTEARQTQRELARMAAIVDSSEEAIVAETMDGSIVTWNGGAERLYGYAASEIIGVNSSVFAQPHEKRLGKEIVARLAGGEAIAPREVIRRRKDGSEVNVSLSFSPIRDTAGQMVGVSCIARDITAWKAAETALTQSRAALQESEARLRRLSDAAFEGIAVSQDGVLVDTNAAFAAQFGYSSPAAMVGVTAELLTAPEARSLVLQKIAKLGEELYETALQRQDGTTFQAEVRGRLTEWGGRPARVTAVRDITHQKTLERELREREAALRAVLESAPVILYATDAEGVVTLSEGTGLTAIGLKPGEAVGHSVFAFSGDPRSAAYTRRALAGEAVFYDAHVLGLCLHTELRPVRDAAGVMTGMIGVCFDVTERVRSEERFRVLFEHSSDAHMLFDEGGIIDCNPAAVALLLCADKAQVLSLHPAVLSPELQPDGRRSDAKCVEMDALARQNGFHRFEWTHRKMDGEDFPVEVTLTPVTLGERPALLTVWHDLTERKRAEAHIQAVAAQLEFQKQELQKANAELAAQATTDGLTGLKNHRVFQERLAEEISRAARCGAPLSVVLLDVDKFKQHNDTYGHPAGDAVLKTVADILQGGARETDIVARYGGEEFVLILPHTDAQGAVTLAERLRASIESYPWPVRAMTASFGVAARDRAEENAAEIIARADAAMYQAKETGRNRVATPPSRCHLPGGA